MPIWTVPARIRRVVDGDTLEADLDLGWGVWRLKAKIRLEDVNAPESGTAEGNAAYAWLVDFLRTRSIDSISGAGIEVPCTVTSRKLDQYGRVLGDVMIDNSSLSRKIIDSGVAKQRTLGGNIR